GAGSAFGAVLSFTTLQLPVATTQAASPIAPTSATLNGTGNAHGASTTGWFRYTVSNPGSCDDTFGTRVPASSGQDLGNGTSDIAFSQAITGLTAGTTYYYCAIVASSVGTSYGTLTSFRTPDGDLVITTLAATSVARSTATINGSADPNGAPATGW